MKFDSTEQNMSPWDKAEFEGKLKACLSRHGLETLASPRTLDLLERFAVRLVTVGAHTNLTAILDGDMIILKHFVDCLTVSPYLPQNAKVVDVGCGGGFPSLPLCIARPDLMITAMDSTAKKVAFVEETGRLLGLCNLRTMVARAEDAGHDPAMREKFDICIARAVSAMPMLSEICLPLVKVGGQFVAMKSRLAEEELGGAAGALPRLGADKPREISLNLSDFGTTEQRTILLVPKISPTPGAYPRAYAQIKKKPL